jgi:hypothetical protein
VGLFTYPPHKTIFKIFINKGGYIMAYRPYIWRKNNPEKRTEQKKREKIRATLRKKGILPPVGGFLNDEQTKILEQISNNDFSYWDTIKNSKLSTPKTNEKTNIKSPEYLIWCRAKQNSKEKGLEFNISVEDIIIPSHCPYLNIPLLTEQSSHHSKSYYSIDRIDSSKGYIKGNIQIISYMANTMKNNATNEQLIVFANNILKLYSSNNLL